MQKLNNIRFKQFALILVMLFMYSVSYTQTAIDIVKKADEKRRGLSAKAEMSISIVRPSWQRDMRVKTWSKENDYSLILITEPARDKGTVFLKREKEIWNWVPSIERNIKLPPSMMMQSWMGSDFTNDDLIKESSIINDYDHNLIGESTILDRACYQIELIPKPDAPVVWGKIYSWISKDDYLELKTEMYDEDGYLVNTVQFSEIKDLGGKLLPSVMEFIPEENPGHKTVIKYHHVDYNVSLSEKFFSIKNMKRVR